MPFDSGKIIKELSANRQIFRELLKDKPEKEYLWKPQPEKWCLLEIVCHLYDEEREDFRARTRHTLENREGEFSPINPPAWVEERQYIRQNYTEMPDKFLRERQQSVEWLQSLSAPQWNNAYQHPKLGKMTAKLFLSNWLAHDYLHIRQILRLKFEYLKHHSGEELSYAGEW